MLSFATTEHSVAVLFAAKSYCCVKYLSGNLVFFASFIDRTYKKHKAMNAYHFAKLVLVARHYSSEDQL